jgi:hypothetical protein
VDLAPRPRSYFRRRFTAGSRDESTERSVVLAQVWMALGILGLVCLDRLGTDLSRSPAGSYSFGFIVYSLFILLLLSRRPECSNTLRLAPQTTDLAWFALLPQFPHESRAALFLLLLVLPRAAQRWGLSGVLHTASEKGSWRGIIDGDGCGLDFDGLLCLPDLDATPRGRVVLRERVPTLGGELAVESTPGRGARLEFALSKEACG